MTAPVVMRSACPDGTSPVNGAPARPVPAILKRVSPPEASSLPRRAKPSIAELSWAGTSMGDTTSVASTRPSACRIGTCSISTTGDTRRAMKACAWTIGSAFGS